MSRLKLAFRSSEVILAQAYHSAALENNESACALKLVCNTVPCFISPLIVKTCLIESKQVSNAGCTETVVKFFLMCMVIMPDVDLSTHV